MKSTAWLVAVILIVGPCLMGCEDKEEKYQGAANVRSKVVKQQKAAKEAQKGKKKKAGRLSKIKKSASDQE